MKAGRLENRLGGFVSALVIAVIVAAMSVLIATPVFAAEVSGDQAGTWTRASSPYIVTGNINILTGQTLTIEPGVVVKFNDNLGI